MANGYPGIIALAGLDGPAVTATGGATCLPRTCAYTFPSNAFSIGSGIDIHIDGRMSNAVTTPGTARFDVRFGSTVIFDSGAFILNQVAKTTLPFWCDIFLTCRAVGPSGNFMGSCRFQSECIVGSPLASVGGSGSILSDVSGGPESAPAVGGNVDLTVANAIEVFFTQTVTTGSMTVHQMRVYANGLAIP